MPYNVSSAFINEVSKDAPVIVRRFYIGNSDYSAYVKKWPSIRREWNEIKPALMSVELANQDKTFNFFKANPVTMVNSCRFEFGVQYAVGSEETIDIYRGKISKLNWKGGKKGATLMMTLKDKLKAFAELVVGDDDNPVTFTGSNYLLSDVAWWMATSYGGLSSIESTSNPDINYSAFQDWAAVFSDGAVYVNAHFDGQKIANVMRRIGKMSNSSIVVEDDLLVFSRYQTSSVAPFSIGSNCLVEADLEINDEEIINRQIWQAAYDVNSDYYAISVTEANTSSVNSYGAREQIDEDDKIWYVDSVSALNIAQRIIDIYGEPNPKYSIETSLRPMVTIIGDTISFNDDLLDVEGDTFRVLGYTLDTQSCKMRMQVDASQLRTFFKLDDATLGLLDQAYNPLG